MRNDGIQELTGQITRLEADFAAAAKRRNDLAAGPPADDPGRTGLRAANKELSQVVSELWSARHALGAAVAAGGETPHETPATPTA